MSSLCKPRDAKRRSSGRIFLSYPHTLIIFQNVDKLLEKSQHEHEMEQLKREKEEALAEEIKITKAGNFFKHASALLSSAQYLFNQRNHPDMTEKLLTVM